MNIIFFGSGHFAPIVLRSIIGEPAFEVSLVVTGEITEEEPATLTAKVARENKLSLFSWTNTEQDIELINKIKSLGPDFLVVADFGHRKKPIPAELLALPHFGAVNIHPSLLPKYRGTTPVQTAIISGDRQIGVSLILMDDKFDHGPLIAQATLPREPSANAPELYEKLFKLGAQLLPKALRRMIEDCRHSGIGTLIWEGTQKVDAGYREPKTSMEIPVNFFNPPQPQDDTKATYTKMLKKEMGRIDWTKSPLEIERMIRAYSGWPGSWTTLEDLFHGYTRLPARQVVPLLGTGGHEAMKQPASPRLRQGGWSNEKRGKLVKIVKTHLSDNRQLVIDLLQIEGKKPISWEEFGRGYLNS